MKLIADSFIYTHVNDVDLSQDVITKDLETTSLWAYQWNMKFNPDITKQAIEVIFSTNYLKIDYPRLSFNGIQC